MKSNKMPMVFIGHGSPLNAIEDNIFTKEWRKLGAQLPKPKAILMISAHWYTRGTLIQTASTHEMVYDMYGFPEELYQINYPAPGLPELAQRVMDLIQSKDVMGDTSWGMDHGSWSVLVNMFPSADIPVVQLSVDGTAGSKEHYELGKQLSTLREEGVLIIASGNVVHNLRQVSWDENSGYPWAVEFDHFIRDAILSGNDQDVIDFEKHPSAKYAAQMPDHFFPLLYVLGAAHGDDQRSVFNDACVMGSLSMTSYLFQ
ncbi:MAG TPA: 4,5-DOPA dioxygenase extradiol [Candidatus Merdenecus merdavium]|nr:4,5-DOPA dioxygenase extradiol [Candidatus Merdenecus merdavium]